MTLPKAIETTRIHSAADLTGDRTALVTPPPFRAPHHAISAMGLTGGGPMPVPGEVSLAHHGVLSLHARPACRRHVLEVLRQPLEDSVATIACALALVMLDMPRVKDRAWWHVLAHSMRAANATRWLRSTICAS